MGKKHKKHRNQHHIIPFSRKNSSNENWNIAIVDTKLHDLYHRLFENKTPDEIIDFLVNYFWNGQEHWLERRLL